MASVCGVCLSMMLAGVPLSPTECVANNAAARVRLLIESWLP